jgi:RNA polymerase sigma factor (sigma-70 family)
MTDTAARRAIDAVWRMEAPRLIAALARIVRDVGIAEELAQDALLVALEQWPKSGVPDKPGAWLLSAARNRAFDQFRRYKMMERRHRELGHELAEAPEWIAKQREEEIDAALDAEVGDDLLRLIFTACHPVLSPEARVALTLRLLCSLTMEEIGRAYLLPEATISQRILRAKRTLAEAHVPFEVPRKEELPSRLASVLNVIYLVFNEGYSATVGESWMRRSLCDEAIRLGRVLAELMPSEPEVHGLIALMELQASRADARVSATGDPVLLLEQNRARWDQLLIRRGLAAFERAVSLGGSLGPYALQAAIAACHATARVGDETDWVRIVALYDALAQLTPSPVIELNRAVAVSMAFGPAVALVLVDALVGVPALATYHLLPSVRGDLLFKLGRLDDARVEFERAASLTKNGSERRLLLKRVEACQAGSE